MVKHEYEVVGFYSSEPTNVGGFSKKNNDGQTTYVGRSLGDRFSHITVTMTGLKGKVKSMVGRKFSMTIEEIQ
jgi:hypothetical protein